MAPSATSRDQPPVDVRPPGMYLRAVTALGELDREPLPPAPPAPPLAEQPSMHQQIQEVISRWRLKSHNYLISDSCFEKFAADLTTAFLSCVEDLMNARREAEAATAATSDGSDGSAESLADESDADSATPQAEGASQISLPEATPAQKLASAGDVPTADPEMTSIVQFDRKTAAGGQETTTEKRGKGSAARYVKPLLIGPLPDDHPATQPIQPLPIRRAEKEPVSEVKITPQQPGAEQSESGKLPLGTSGPASPATLPRSG